MTDPADPIEEAILEAWPNSDRLVRVARDLVAAEREQAGPKARQAFYAGVNEGFTEGTAEERERCIAIVEERLPVNNFMQVTFKKGLVAALRLELSPPTTPETCLECSGYGWTATPHPITGESIGPQPCRSCYPRPSPSPQPEETARPSQEKPE